MKLTLKKCVDYHFDVNIYAQQLKNLDFTIIRLFFVEIELPFMENIFEVTVISHFGFVRITQSVISHKQLILV